jgi:hypothetical protein
MGSKVNIQKEVYASYKALETIKSISKISAIAVKSLDNSTLKIEDFEEIFKTIITKCEEVETSVSLLETLDK